MANQWNQECSNGNYSITHFVNILIKLVSTPIVGEQKKPLKSFGRDTTLFSSHITSWFKWLFYCHVEFKSHKELESKMLLRDTQRPSNVIIYKSRGEVSLLEQLTAVCVVLCFQHILNFDFDIKEKIYGFLTFILCNFLVQMLK